MFPGLAATKAPQYNVAF